jgi:CubicO group peptidase (beta-lactamase class C family)
VKALVRPRVVSFLAWIVVSSWIAGCSRPAEGPVTSSIAAAVVRGDIGARLDRFVTQAADSGFNGCVLVARRDTIVIHKGYGFADAARTQPVTIETRFWIASVSKQFAAAAILHLAEDKHLSLSDSLPRFFRDVPDDKRSITVHQLMTHTAGLAQQYAADGIADRDAAVRAVLAQPLARPPGTGFGYSNDAYNLVAAIVEIAAKRPYEAYVRQALLDPAQLGQTGFWADAGSDRVAAILGDVAWDPTLARPNWGFRGAVGMYSTSADLYRWNAALDAGRVLRSESVQQLRNPHIERETTSIAYGWFVTRTQSGTTSVWTRGYEGFGHGAVLATYPQERVVIVVTSNSGDRDRMPVTHKMAQDLASLVLPDATR